MKKHLNVIACPFDYTQLSLNDEDLEKLEVDSANGNRVLRNENLTMTCKNNHVWPIENGIPNFIRTKKDHSKRWNTAQDAEKNFWTKKKLAHMKKPFWDSIIENFSPINFRNLIVMEIGCGPSGAIGFVEGSTKIGIDPIMNIFYEKFSSSSAFYMTAMGEHLPIAEESIDIAICFNVLDHVFNPSAFIDEASRILKSEGVFLLWVHTLKRRGNFCRILLNHFDKAHPFHFTDKKIFQLLEKSFNIEKITETTPLTSETYFKARIGNFFMKNLYISLRKKK